MVVREALRQSSNLQGLSRREKQGESAQRLSLLLFLRYLFWNPDEHYSRDLHYICYEAILSVFVDFESQVDIRTKIEFVGELLQILENVLFGKMHFLTLGKVSS